MSTLLPALTCAVISIHMVRDRQVNDLKDGKRDAKRKDPKSIKVGLQEIERRLLEIIDAQKMSPKGQPKEVSSKCWR